MRQEMNIAELRAQWVTGAKSTGPKQLWVIVDSLQDDSFADSLGRRREQAAGLRCSDPFADS